MLYSYILIKFEVCVVIDFIFIWKNYAFIRGLYLLLQFITMFITNEFIKFPRGLYSFIIFIYLFIYIFIYLFIYLFIIYLFIRKLYLLEVMLLD